MESSGSFFSALLSFGESALETVTPVLQNTVQNAIDRVTGNDENVATNAQPAQTVAQAQANEAQSAANATQSTGLLGFVSANPAIAVGGTLLTSAVLFLLLKGK